SVRGAAVWSDHIVFAFLDQIRSRKLAGSEEIECQRRDCPRYRGGTVWLACGMRIELSANQPSCLLPKCCNNLVSVSPLDIPQLLTAISLPTRRGRKKDCSKEGPKRQLVIKLFWTVLPSKAKARFLNTSD